MKKIIPVLLITLLCLTLSACSNSSDKPKTQDQNQSQTQSQTPNQSQNQTPEQKEADEDIDTGGDEDVDNMEEEDQQQDGEEYTEEEYTEEEQALIASIDYIRENATAAFIGATSDGSDVVFVQTPEMAAIAFVSSAGQSVSFVGAYEESEENRSITILDERLQVSFTLAIVEVNEDGSILCDVGDLGQIGLAPATADQAAAALLIINQLSEPAA